MTTIELFEIFDGFYAVLISIWDWLNQPLSEFVAHILTDGILQNTALGQLLTNIVQIITGTLLGDSSLLVFMIGTGLLSYIVYQFAIWVLNLVT